MLKGERMLQQDLEQQFSAMRAGDADPSDLAARLLVVASCGVALWLATGQQIMLIWGFGYAVLNILFAVFLLVVFAGGSPFDWFPLRGLLSEEYAGRGLAAGSEAPHP